MGRFAWFWLRHMATLAALLAAVLPLSCQEQQTDDPIPFVAFDDVEINLSVLPRLMRDGGAAIDNRGGVRGIIVYRERSDRYLVYERNCSYRPNSACATVDIDPSGLFMHDACCGSIFRLEDGRSTSGPAWRPLRQYRTQLLGAQLIVTDELL